MILLLYNINLPLKPLIISALLSLIYSINIKRL